MPGIVAFAYANSIMSSPIAQGKISFIHKATTITIKSMVFGLLCSYIFKVVCDVNRLMWGNLIAHIGVGVLTNKIKDLLVKVVVSVTLLYATRRYHGYYLV
jgi:hypothetical protein